MQAFRCDNPEAAWIEDQKTIEGEVVNESTDLAVRESSAPIGLFGTDKPELVIVRATKVAGVLKDVIVKQGFAIKISGREYVKVEGWTTLGAMVGVYPKVEYSRPITGDDGEHLGWEAAVLVVNNQGAEISRAEAQCLREERNWKNRDDFAIRSMAQTRAMGKALRLVLGFIAVLAGYEATPAEEMPAPEVADTDIPFDESGAAQGPGGESSEAQSDAPGTGRAAALETRRIKLTAQILGIADELGIQHDAVQKIAQNRETAATPAKHLTYLEKTALPWVKAKLAEKEAA